MRKLLVYCLALLVLSSFAFAALDTNLVGYWSMDNVSGNTIYDSIGNYDATKNANIVMTTQGIRVNASNFTNAGTNEAIVTNIDDFVSLGNFTLVGWFNGTPSGYAGFFSEYGTSGPATGWAFNTVSDGTDLTLYERGDHPDCTQTYVADDVNDGQWHQVGIIWRTDNTVSFLYDGAFVLNFSGCTLGDGDQSGGLWIGNYYDATQDRSWPGLVDEVSYYNRSISTDEVSDLYNNSFGNFYPFSSPAPTPNASVVNESLESTFFIEQGANVTTTGAGWQTIVDADFNITVNDSEFYVSATSEMSTDINGDASCRMLFDDSDDFESIVTRTFTAGSIGSLYLLTEPVYRNVSTVNVKYQCIRLTPSMQMSVANTKIVGHIMIDEFNRSVPLVYRNFSVSTSSNSLSLIDSFLFNVSNISVNNSEGVVSNLVIDWRAEYDNDHLTVGEELNTLVSINGSNCSVYPRYVGAVSTGIIGGDCQAINVTTNGTLNISFFAAGNDSTFDVKLFAKEFYSHVPQVNFSNLTGLNVSSSSYQTIASHVGGNTDHASANVFVKAGIPLSSGTGSTSADFVFRLNNSVDVNSSVFSRSVDTENGVLIMQYIFRNIPVANYTISLLGRCGDSDCTINGGEMISYVTDPISVLINSFNVSVTDDYDGTVINVFNVSTSEGNTFQATTGSVLVTSQNALENLTISSANYVNNTILNHNTSTDLAATLWQSEITFNAYKKASGEQVFNFSVVEGVKNDTTFNGSAILYLPSGLHNVTFNSSGFFNSTITVNVSAGDIRTVNFTGISDARLNISVFNATVNNTVFNISGNVSHGSFFESFNSTNFFILLNLTSGLEYNVSVTAVNFTGDQHFNLQTVTLSADLQDAQFNLWRDRSLFITFRESSSDDLIEGVDLQMLGVQNFNFTVDNSSFLFPFPDGAYTLIATKTGFSTFTTNITTNLKSMVNVTGYMANESQSIQFTVRDVAGGFIENARIIVTRRSDGVVIAERFTDIFGAAQMSLDIDIPYDVNVTSSGFVPFFGTLNAFQTSYTVTLSTSGVNQQGFIGLDYRFLPSAGAVIVNNTMYNFSFNISSNGYWDLTSCNFTVLNNSASGSILGSNTTFCSVSGGFARFELNSSEYSAVVSRVDLVLNGTNNVTLWSFYTVTDSYQGSFSLMTFFDDLRNFSGSGFSSVALTFLTVLVIIGLTVLLGQQLNVFGEPEKMLLFATVLTGAASYLDLLNMGFTPLAFNPLAAQYIVFVVMALLTIAAWLASPSWRLS